MAVTEWTRELASTLTSTVASLNIGTLTLTSAKITDTSGTINFENENLTTTGIITGNSLVGTISTAAQPNITSFGTLASLTIDDINIDGQTITTTGSNNFLALTPHGTGDIQLNADTVRAGDENANFTLTTWGTGDLTLNTNAGTDSGSIIIADAANGDITIGPNGSGKVITSGTGGLKVGSNKILDGGGNTILSFDGSGKINDHVSILENKELRFDTSSTYIKASTAADETMDFAAAGNFWFSPGADDKFVIAGKNSGTSANSPMLELLNTHNGDKAPMLKLYNERNSNNGASSDSVGAIRFSGRDTSGNETEYISLTGTASTATDGQEKGTLSVKLATHSSGSMVEGLSLASDAVAGTISSVIGAGDVSTNKMPGRLGVGTSSLQSGWQCTVDSNGGQNIYMRSSHATEGPQITWEGSSGGTDDSDYKHYIDMYNKQWRFICTPGDSAPISTFTPILVNMKSSNTNIGVNFDSIGDGTISVGKHKHSISKLITCTKAHTGDNTVIAECFKVPAYAIITRLFVTLQTKSNLATYSANISYSTNTGIAADGALTGTSAEMLGAGVDTHTGAASYGLTNLSQANADINMATGATTKIPIWRGEPEVGQYINVGNAPIYLYVCNAGTGNGTTDASTSAVLHVYCEYVSDQV